MMLRLPRPWRSVAVAFMCASLAACLPETDTWLSDPATAKPDPRLIGVFIGDNTGPDRNFVVTGPVTDKDRKPVKGKDGKPGAVMHLVWTQIQFDNGRKTVVWASYRAWPARLPGGVTLLNLERVTTGPHTAQLTPKRSFALYYVADDGSVRVRLPRNRPWSQAVQSGAIEGKVVKGRYIDQITLTASREKLARYIAANAGALFESPGQVWRRVK